MKKLICLVLAALLCVGAVALAEAASSKTTGDMNQTTGTKTETGKESGVVVTFDVSAEAKLRAEEERQKLADSASPDDYFGVSVTEKLGVDKVNVHEFLAFNVINYDPAEGSVTTTICFTTPYKANERVLVMVGVTNANGEIEWVALEGVGTGVNGEITVTFPADLLEAIKASGVEPLMAVVSA